MTVSGYEIIEWTRHWSRIDGAWYRDAIARRMADGAVRVIAVLDEA